MIKREVLFRLEREEFCRMLGGICDQELVPVVVVRRSKIMIGWRSESFDA